MGCGTKVQWEHHASPAFDPLGVLNAKTSKGRGIWGGEEAKEKADGVFTKIYQGKSLISQQYRLKRNICMFDSGLVYYPGYLGSVSFAQNYLYKLLNPLIFLCLTYNGDTLVNKTML